MNLCLLPAEPIWFSIFALPIPAQRVQGIGSTPFPYAQFRLVLLDPKTHIALWTLSESFVGTGLKNNREKKFDDTLDKLVGDLKALVAQPGAATN